jgi:hypothetical protein
MVEKHCFFLHLNSNNIYIYKIPPLKFKSNINKYYIYIYIYITQLILSVYFFVFEIITTILLNYLYMIESIFVAIPFWPFFSLYHYFQVRLMHHLPSL